MCYNQGMMKFYLREKRKELIWAISDQDYTQTDIAELFRTNKMTINRIVNGKPEGWVTPWTKKR